MKSLSFMAKVLLVLTLLATKTSAQIQLSWVAKYNNNGITNGNHQALKTTLDSTGNIYVLGVSANANTNTGYAVVKYAPNGNQLWTARYDSTNFPAATPTGFALDSSNNVIVTGSAVTAKYDVNGNLLWTAPYNAQSLAVDAGQNIYLTGVSSNFMTIKLNPEGSNLWTQTHSYSPALKIAQMILIDSSTNVYVAGGENLEVSLGSYAYLGLVKYNSDGTQLWANDQVTAENHYLQVVGAKFDKSGNIYLECNATAGGTVDVYQTTKFNPDGSTAWFAFDPTGYGSSFSTALVLDSTDETIVTGHYGYPSSYGTYKIDTNGNYVWTNLYPMSTYDGGAALALGIDSANNLYVTGELSSTNTPYNIVTLKLAPNGNQLWVQRYNGPGLGNAGNAIVVDNSGNVYVAGYETEANGFTSMILIKYSPVAGQKQSNGDFILHAYGSPGESFDLHASTNLQTWQDLGSVIADTNGVALFTDTNAPLFPNRFYYTVPQ
jgi:hypothetical protein